MWALLVTTQLNKVFWTVHTFVPVYICTYVYIMLLSFCYNLNNQLIKQSSKNFWMAWSFFGKYLNRNLIRFWLGYKGDQYLADVGTNFELPFIRS